MESATFLAVILVWTLGYQLLLRGTHLPRRDGGGREPFGVVSIGHGPQTQPDADLPHQRENCLP